MKLLFNLNDNGSDEIKEILGFTDADLSFATLKPYIIPATDEIIKIIGQNMYTALTGIYENNSASDTDLEFLQRTQFAILQDAYRNSAVDTDLAHTPNGRVNRVEEHQKIAFEWQIDRSNKQMERKYYKAVDALIKFMDNNVSGWKATDAYKSTYDLLLRTPAEFDVYFNIEGSRLLMLKLAPGIRKCERDDILPRIGKERFETLKTKLKDNDTDFDAKLLEMIIEASVYKSLSWGIPRLSAQLFPEGLLQVADTSRLSTTARKSIENKEAEALSGRFKKDAADAFLQIENYITSLNPVQAEIPEIKPLFNQEDTFVSC